MVAVETWLSVLVGSGATLVAGLLVYWKRRCDRRTNLRTALEHEIQGMQGQIKGFAGAIESDDGPQGDPIPEINFITTVVYENNTQHLGLLTDSEVDAITDFYNSAIQLSRVLDMLTEHENPNNTASYYAWFRDDNMSEVLNKNEKALEEIQKHI